MSNPGGLPKNQPAAPRPRRKRVMDFGKRYLPERMLDSGQGVRNDNLEKQRMAPEERAAAMAAFREDILRTRRARRAGPLGLAALPTGPGKGAGAWTGDPCLMPRRGPRSSPRLIGRREILYEREGERLQIAKGIRPTDLVE